MAAFQAMLNTDFNELISYDNSCLIGEEVSPYMMTGLGIQYPAYSTKAIIERAEGARASWLEASAEQRAQVLTASLDKIAERFFDIAYATMHTTGQSFVMSFQASGPHANDRALEVIAMAYEELSRFADDVAWVKPMGKFDLKLKKDYRAIGRGIGLCIGCSTFPTWNTVPGVYANLMAGNPTIVKPHSKSVLPIAIVVAEIQKALQEAGFSGDQIQLAVDSQKEPITKLLAEHEAVQLIDYTGGSSFGEYIEKLDNKTTFTEKAGVNSLIIDGVKDMQKVAGNIAFSTCLYSGQMCTAPQNIFVPEQGIKTAEGTLSYDEVVKHIAEAIKGLVENPKAGPYTLGAIQNDRTATRVKEMAAKSQVALDSIAVKHPEFESARMMSPVLITCSEDDIDQWQNECFGPALFVVKTKDSNRSLAHAKRSAQEIGAITCALYSNDEGFIEKAVSEMNMAFTPVSVNFRGAAFVNQHAAFSDFHVTGGNPSGNAGFTNPEYVNKRWIWVGNRYA
jgi:phenylacetic acid degradation protein paaN